MEGDMEEEENGEPLVVEVVAVAEVAMEVVEVGGGWAGAEGVGGSGNRECEGLVLPDVVLGEGGYCLEDFEVEGVERGGGGGGGSDGGGIRVYGVENGVV